VKRVLITGAMGALGRVVVEHIKKIGTYQIFATSTQVHTVHDDSVTVSLCNFKNLDQLTAAFDLAQPDLILHLGGSLAVNLSDAYIMNVAPAAHLLELILSRGLNTRIVLIGSAAEYGVVKPQENPINEDHTLFPVSVYGISKAWQTQLLGFYATRGIDVICARIFNLYGPGLSEKLFAGRLQRKINDIKMGHQSIIEVGSLAAIRDYITITEAACQLLTIARHGIVGNIYHIASGNPVNMRDFLIKQLEIESLSSSLIHEATGYSNHSGYDVPVIFADMKKTQFLEKWN
jgi:GDP-4-dehydro-6-deoxy-D-mannose reductase